MLRAGDAPCLSGINEMSMKKELIVLDMETVASRRSFLLSVGAVAAAAFLPGCAEVPARSGQDSRQPLDPRVAVNSRKRGMSAAELHDARQAQRVFAALDRTGMLPAGEHLAILQESFRQKLALLPAALNDIQMAALGGDLAGILRTSLARVRRLEAGPVRVEKPVGGVLDIPAMAAVKVSLRGFCIDEGLPAPGRGALLRFRPATDFENVRLEHLEGAVLRYAQVNPDKARHHEVQHILWGLRGLGSKSMFTATLAKRRDLLGIMEQAAPGSVSRFLDEFRKAERERAAREQLHRILPSLARIEQLLAGELLNPAASGAAIERYLASMKPADNEKVPPEAAYSILGHGIYARTNGTAALMMNAEIINVSGSTFPFDPTRWVAESQRAQQRVAFSGIARVDPLQAGPPSGDFDLPDFLAGVARDLGFKALGEFEPGQAARRAYELGRADRRTTRKLAAFLSQASLGVIPVLGNIVSVYEFLNGRDFFTDEALSPAERVLAAAGSIPGYGAMLKATGSFPQFADFFGKALRSKAISVPLSAVDKTEWIRDLAAIAIDDSKHEEKLWDASVRTAAVLVTMNV